MGARLVSTIALPAAVVLLAGCGGSSQSQATPDGAPTTSVETTTAPTATGTTAPTTTEPRPRPPKPSMTTITIRVVGGKPQGGIARPEVGKDESVVLVVRSDVADEVHVHGYDVSRPVAAGGVARMAFVAKIPGRFEVELEERGIQIAELTVR